MKKLSMLISNFDKHELTLIRYGLKGADAKEQKLYLKLFDYLVKAGQDANKAEASEKVYGAPADARIQKLTSRLQEKVLDIIISESFLIRNKKLSDFEIKRARSRKRTNQISMLFMLGGQTPFLSELVEKTMNDLQNADSPWLLAELLRFKRGLVYYSKSSKELEECRRQIIFYKKCAELTDKIQEYYYEVIRTGSYGEALSPHKTKKRIAEMIQEIESEKEFLQSIHARYLYGMIRSHYYSCDHDHLSAKRELESLYPVTIKTSGSPNYYHEKITCEIGWCEMQLGNYKDAIQKYEKNLPLFFRKNKVNYYNSLENLFRGYFYQSHLVKAESMVKVLVKEAGEVHGNFRMGKYKYYDALAKFMRNDFQHCFAILNTASALSKDKTGYDIAVRILRIQCLIMMDKLNETTHHIVALRKHISRYYDKFHLNERLRIAVHILVQMDNRGFAGAPTVREMEMVKNLVNGKGKYRWEPFSPELIRFEEWYKSL